MCNCDFDCDRQDPTSCVPCEDKRPIKAATTPNTLTGYLQHKAGPRGPFRTESVKVRHEYADRYRAFFEGHWRRVFIQVGRTYIRYQGERITVQIDGV